MKIELDRMSFICSSQTCYDERNICVTRSTYVQKQCNKLDYTRLHEESIDFN